MRWDLFLVPENASLRVTPKAVTLVLRTLLTDGRIAGVEEVVDPDEPQRVSFWCTPGEMAHGLFFEGPKLSPEPTLSALDVEMFPQRQQLPHTERPQPIPGAEAEDEPERYWFWLRLANAQYNFVSGPLAERLETALRMKVLPQTRPCVGPVVARATYPASVDTVWRALTEPDQMRQWLSPQIEDFRPKPGFRTEVPTTAWEQPLVHQWRVLAARPFERLVLSWRYADVDGDSTVSWDLASNGAQTTVRVTHRGWDAFDARHRAFGREATQVAWDTYLHERLPAHLGVNSA